MSVFYTIENNVGTITFDQKDKKVNVLTRETLTRLSTILDEIRLNPQLTALLIRSAKKDIFIAGADIQEIEGITDPAEGAEKARYGQDVFNKLEDLPVPTVAVIDGAALGGGCELALACDYRVATFNEKVRVGLPEVTLGILPGFGGTYRLPRLIGLPQALTMILTGKPVDHKKALKIGLVDQLIPRSGIEGFLREFIVRVKGARRRKSSFNRRLSAVQKFQENSWPGRRMVMAAAHNNVMKASKGFYPAPLKALETIDETIGSKKRDVILQKEARAFSELAVTPVCKNLIHVFYLSETYRKLSIPGTEDKTPQAFHRVGVLGAGVMGGGIAQILSYKDVPVRLKDINYQAVATGLKSAYGVFQKAVSRRRLTPAQAWRKMNLISGTIDYRGFAKLDAVIEAVVENMDVKKDVLRQLTEVISDDVLVCTNTSALSVTEMMKPLKNPSRGVGFHFFNPVHLMPLVEIIKGEETSDQTLADALALARLLNKTPIFVKDAPGFLVNRILLSYINEAGRILEEGGEIEEIDKVMTGFGMPMGPLALSDEVGLDVGIKVLKILEEGLGERFAPVDLFQKVYQKGYLGKKSGKGFYIYQGKKPAANQEIYQSRPGPGNSSFQDHQDRMVYIMINEAAMCLQEGIVDSAATVDTGMIMGTGFPPFRGGLLKFADGQGVDAVIEKLQYLQHKFRSPRFRPCECLIQMKDEKKKFY